MLKKHENYYCRQTALRPGLKTNKLRINNYFYNMMDDSDVNSLLSIVCTHGTHNKFSGNYWVLIMVRELSTITHILSFILY